MKKLVGLAALCGAMACGAETLAFIGDSDKNPVAYALNETITFNVKLVDKDAGNAIVPGKELRWTLSGDDSSLNKSGTASSDSPLTVTTAIREPGFVRLTVKAYENNVKLGDDKMVFDGGAGADVMNIPEWPEPSDFRAFWQNATNTLYTTPYTTVCTNFTPSGANANVEYSLFELSVPGDSRPATGIIAKPRGAATGSCGIIANVYGYGWGATPIPNAGDVNSGKIVINITRHGEYPVHPDADYYSTTVQNEMKTNGKQFCWRNNDTGDARDTDYYKMVMRDLRAIQFAKSLPEWNGTFLKMTGGSMGGWQAIACTALDCDVTECSASIPWSADLAAGVKYGRMTGWRPDWTSSLDYIDLKNLAKLVTVPVTFNAGLGDYVCPPSGEILLFKNLPEPKKVTFTQNMGHGSVYGPNAASYVMQLPVPPPPPRMLKWVGGGANKLFSTAANWKDTEGNTNAVPRSGDTLTIDVNTGTAKNDIANFYPQQIRVSGYQEHDSSGEPLIFTGESGGIYNTGYLYYDLPTALVGTNVTFFSSSTIVARGRFNGLNGADCGIVKTGTQRAGINGAKVSSPADYAGFRFVTVREGEWIYGINGGTAKMHLLPPGQTMTFAAAGTKINFSQPCVFTNGWIRETGAAVGGNHAISCQVDSGVNVYRGKLTLCGTPPVDSMTFTGTFETAVDFCWKPDDATKEFVIIGKNSTTTGNLEVANGKVRLTSGATFSQLGELKLSGAGATLQIDDVPTAPFKASSLVLVTGNAKLNLCAGATITVDGAIVGGIRMTPKTYTSANCTWVTGAGAVVVQGMTNYTLTWAKKATYSNLNWNNPANWVNDTTGVNEAPVDGDTIKIPGNSGYSGVENNNNNLVNFRPNRIYVQNGYSSPSGNAVIFDGTDSAQGIYNSGFMYYRVPTIVNKDVIVMEAKSNVGHQGDIYSTDGHEFTVRKTGTGHWALQNNGNNKYTGFKRINIEGGKFSLGWQDYGVGDKFPVGLTANYAAKDTHITFSKPTVLTDFVITESGNAVNQTHYIGPAPDNTSYRNCLDVTLAGTPAVKSQVFTGIIQKGISWKWAVDDPECEFVFSGASSANVTTNSLIVTNGTVRLAKGATFTQLKTLELLAGAGTRFEVDDPPAQPFHAKELIVETGNERLKVASGVKIAVDTLKVNGETLAAGVYSSNDGIATGADWIEGGGFVCVGGVDVTLPTPTETVAVNWTANGGSDKSVGNAANWGAAGNTVLPNLDDGSLAATFAAGTGAKLDRVAAFRSVALNASGSFDFTSDAGKFAFLGDGGVTTAGTSSQYGLGWPMYLTCAQTWNVGAGDVINLTGKLNGSDKLVLQGTGTLNVNSSGMFVGEVVASNGTLNVNADCAFGESKTKALSIDLTKTKLNLNGVTLKRPLKALKPGTLTLPAGTANVIEGDCDFRDASAGYNINLYAGASLRFKGRFMRATTQWAYFTGKDVSNPGTLYFDVPMYIDGGAANGLGGNLNTYFNAPSNAMGGVWFWVQGSNNRIYTTVPYAFAPYVDGVRSIVRADGAGVNNVWDLCGNDQGLHGFGANANVTVTSEKPAVLHVERSSNAYEENVSTNRACWAGAAGLSFEGSRFMCLAGTSTSTGIVQVTSGRLEFLGSGSWTGASEAVVKGGTMVLPRKGIFGDATKLDLKTGGVMNLNYAGTMKVGALKVDGEEMPNGVYGGASSQARTKLAVFSGSGMISVGIFGTAIIVR